MSTTILLGIFNIGTFELLLVAGAAVLFFGGDLPDMARKGARLLARLRAMTQDLTRELSDADLPRPTSLRDDPRLGELRKTLGQAARLPGIGPERSGPAPAADPSAPQDGPPEAEPPHAEGGEDPVERAHPEDRHPPT